MYNHHKFMNFISIYRLLNPKIVRACVVVLTDWEQIPTKSLKAAVTILHRIAYGCSCPAMLYQVSLYLIYGCFNYEYHSAPYSIPFYSFCSILCKLLLLLLPVRYILCYLFFAFSKRTNFCRDSFENITSFV